MWHDYLQGFMMALGSGTVVVCWRWLEPLRAEIVKRHKQRKGLRSDQCPVENLLKYPLIRWLLRGISHV